MRKLVVAGIAALAFLVPSPARAVIFLGARVGYALPSGDVQKDQPIKDSIKATVPIQVDAGLSVLSLLSFGLYGSIGPSTIAQDLKSTACSGISCKGQQLRVGAQLNASVPLIPVWGGVFAGLEQQQLTFGSRDTKVRGWETGIQAGWDFSVLPLIKIGPFASYSFGEFTTGSGDNTSIRTKAQHTALTFGLRGLFDL